MINYMTLGVRGPWFLVEFALIAAATLAVLFAVYYGVRWLRNAIDDYPDDDGEVL